MEAKRLVAAFDDLDQLSSRRFDAVQSKLLARADEQDRRFKKLEEQSYTVRTQAAAVASFGFRLGQQRAVPLSDPNRSAISVEDLASVEQWVGAVTTEIQACFKRVVEIEIEYRQRRQSAWTVAVCAILTALCLYAYFAFWK